ncbi:MAG: hypothetical protein Q7R73_01305 [bacterium]|nr:hypothetical protein [bacterium]
MKIPGRLGVFVLLLTILASVSTAFAVEKLDSCPMEFDPDNSAWAMHEIKIKERGLYRIYEHRLSYFPDPEKRIFVGIKKIENPNCIAALVSYGFMDDAGGKRVYGAIASPNGIRYYLFIDGAWKQGDDIAKVFDCDTEEACNLVFVLYKGKAPIASLVVVIER